jgi:RNA polymerase sigma-70 factor (ECF subfamily)
MVDSPAAGLAALNDIATMPGMADYYLLHVTAAEFHRRAGNPAAALTYYRRAEQAIPTAPERRYVARKIAELQAVAR